MPKATRIIETSVGKFTVRQASDRYGIPIPTIQSRIKHNWTPDEVCGIVQRIIPKLTEDRLGWVYGWWCKSKHKYLYIGLTVQSVKQRTQSHFLSAKKGCLAPLYVAIRENGADNFEVHTLWSGPSTWVRDKEIFYISEYKTRIEQGGFNSRIGGEIGTHGGETVSYRGKEYSSALDVWRSSDKEVSHATFCRRLRKGATLEEALTQVPDPRLSPLAVRGKIYKSKSEAFREESVSGLKQVTFNQRLRKGWTTEQALGLESPPEQIRLTVGGKDYPTLKDACKAYNKSYKLVHGQVNLLGWTVEEALGIDSRKPRWDRVSINVKGCEQDFPSAQAAWKMLGAGIKYTTFLERTRRGWSLEEALELVKRVKKC
jgi:hypothetical protein